MHDFIKKLIFFLQNKKILIPLHPLYDKIERVLNGNRGVAQLVSASALGAEGPPFESEYPDKKELYESVAPFLSYTLLPYPAGQQKRAIHSRITLFVLFGASFIERSYLISIIASEMLMRKSPTCSYSEIRSM